MGKKSQKGKATEEPPPSDGGAALSGELSKDFPILCEQVGLPKIPVRILPRAEVGGEEEEDGDGKQGNAILAEYESTESPAKLKAIHVRGWLLSEEVVGVVEKALAGSQLISLNLWNVGLNAGSLSGVCQLVQQLNLKRLSLDGNPVSLEPIAKLLSPDSTCSLEHVSLKCCSFSPSSLLPLIPPLSSNKTLLSLDLSCNHLGDEGAGLVASALRLNRTLLSLSLANNSIGDAGAIRLAEVLSRFPLNHEEVVTRRKLLSQRRLEDGQSALDLSHNVGTRRSPSSVSVDRSGKSSKAEKGAKGKKTEPKKEDKGKKGGDTGKKGRGKDSRAGRKDVLEEAPQSEPTESAVHPLLEPLEEGAGHQLFMPGNMALVHLTLSYNAIGEDGLQALLEAVRLQGQYSHLGPAGLLRLALHHVSAPPTSSTLHSISELLTARGPSHSPEFTDGSTQ